jgi:hypothetical protein
VWEVLGGNEMLARRGESTDLALLGQSERRNRAAESEGLYLFHKLLLLITAIWVIAVPNGKYITSKKF